MNLPMWQFIIAQLVGTALGIFLGYLFIKWQYRKK